MPTDQQAAALASIDAIATALAVAQFALEDAASTLRASLADPAPHADPQDEPLAPAPEPEPPMPATSRPAAIAKPINRAAALVFRDWVVRGGRYSRWQEVARLTDGGVTILANASALSAGGGVLGLQSDSYTLTIDGEPVSTVTVTPGAKVDLAFQFDPVTIPSGWHVMDIIPASGTETCVPMPALVPPRDGDPPPEWMPVWSGGYEVAVSGQPARIDWVPAQFEPTELPLAPREYVPFDTALPRSNFALSQIVPARGSYIRRPVVTADGVLATANVQWYTVGDFVAKTPRVPLLDGPRGRCSLGFPSHIQIGAGTFSADPASAPMNNLYVAHPWGVVRVSDSGHVTTLFGLRHPGIASYWEDPSNVELVGDFSQADNLAPHEIWGFAWDSASLVVDTAHPPIPSELGRQPHAGAGPFMAVADSQNNRLLGVQFDAKAHGIPPVVTVIARLQDPWMVVEWRDSWIVSERKAHRIVQISKATGEIERVIVQGAALANIDHSRLVQRLAALDVLRAEPCVAPEGLALWGDWLYFASIAQRDVRRVHLVTGELQIRVANVVTNRNFFLNIAVSTDGTFGEPGSMLVTDWEVVNFGFPLAYKADGTKWSINTYSGSTSIPVGPGGVFDSFGYSAAVGVRAGRMVFGGAGEGLMELRRTPPGLPTVNGSLYNQGARRWTDDGLHLRYGPNGWGYYGEPLPWGYSAETDYYLTVHGHAPETVAPDPEPNPEPDPTPDPDPQLTGGLTFTKTAADSSAPDGTPQAVVLTLHGSGTIAPEFGQRGFIEWPEYLQYRGSVRTYAAVQRVKSQGYAVVRPWDNNSADPDPLQPSVPRRQSLWMGWTDTADGVDHMMPVVEDRLDALLDWLPSEYPEMSRTKVAAMGGSMGGWGCASYAARRPDRFAAVYASRPRVRSASPGGAFKVNDWTTVSQARPLTSDLRVGAAWGGGRVAERLDLIAYAANPANRLPWLAFTLGRQDGFAPFDDFVDLVAALRATGRGFACQWTNGNHGDAKMVSMADILRTYPLTTFELGVGYPVFSNCSLDQDPAVDLAGGINLGLQFRNVVESDTGWSCEVMHRDEACVVDVSPRSDVFAAQVPTQTVTLPAAGVWVPVSFAA